MGDQIHTDYLLKADKFLKRAEVLMASKIIALATRYEGVCQLNYLASDYYRIAGKPIDAGQCLITCAKLQSRLGHLPEAASFYLSAARVLRTFDPAESIKNYSSSLAVFLEIHNFRVCGRIQLEIGELLEKDRKFDKAGHHYKNAALLFTEQRDYVATSSALIKSAETLLRVKKFKKAAKCFEEAGMINLQENCLKFNSPKHFLNAALCLLADEDLRSLAEMFDKVKKRDKNFTRTREYLFVKNIVQSLIDADMAGFADHTYNFDNVCKLNSMQIRLLSHVRTSLEEILEESDDEQSEIDEDERSLTNSFVSNSLESVSLQSIVTPSNSV